MTVPRQRKWNNLTNTTAFQATIELEHWRERAIWIRWIGLFRNWSMKWGDSQRRWWRTQNHTGNELLVRQTREKASLALLYGYQGKIVSISHRAIRQPVIW